MKLGIMQPYFLPYIGYWQLMNAVDKYVIYDDVNFIKGGWINRNRILINGAPSFINIPMIGASSQKLINQVGVNTDTRLHEKNIRMIEDVYRRAPYFSDCYPVLADIIRYKSDNLADYVANSIIKVADYLQMDTEFIISSSIDKDCSLKGKDKVIQICNIIGAEEYYNAIGGIDLYDKSEFKDHGINLHFLRTNEIKYRQYGDGFVSNLSIIDMMMFNSLDEIKENLRLFSLE